MKNTTNEIGNSLGIACTRTLLISTWTLTAALGIQAIIFAGNGLSIIEKPVQRVGIMAGLIMGFSAAGCILGAVLSSKKETEEPISKDTYITVLEEKLDLANSAHQRKEQFYIDRIEDKNRQLKEVRTELSELRGDFFKLKKHIDNIRTLDERYSILDCCGCRHYQGQADGGNFFVCAMHPYGQKNCGDREGLRSEL